MLPVSKWKVIETDGYFFKFPTTNITSEAVVRRCSVRKVFLEILQIHRKTPVPESLF